MGSSFRRCCCWTFVRTIKWPTNVGWRVAHIHVSPLAPSFISKWTERICNRGHICFSLLCILNKSCDECTFKFIHCGIRKWIICLRVLHPIPQHETHPSLVSRQLVPINRCTVVDPMAMVVVCGRTCCRFDVWPTIYLQSCAMPIVRIESGLESAIKIYGSVHNYAQNSIIVLFHLCRRVLVVVVVPQGPIDHHQK